MNHNIMTPNPHKFTHNDSKQNVFNEYNSKHKADPETNTKLFQPLPFLAHQRGGKKKKTHIKQKK